MDETYSAVQFRSGKNHAVWAMRGPGSINNFDTFCGIQLRYRDEFRECSGDEPITCKACRRSLSSRSAHDPTARQTLAIGMEQQP